MSGRTAPKFVSSAAQAEAVNETLIPPVTCALKGLPGTQPHTASMIAGDSVLPTVVVAIACSAGGLALLADVLGGLPVDFPGVVIALQHQSPTKPRSTDRLGVR